MKTTCFLNAISEDDMKKFIELSSDYSARAYFEIKHKSPMIIKTKKTKDENGRQVFRVNFLDKNGVVKDSEDYGEFFISSDEKNETSLSTISVQERRWYNFVADKNEGKTNSDGQSYTKALQNYYSDLMIGKMLAKMNEINSFMGNSSYKVMEKPQQKQPQLKAKY